MYKELLSTDRIRASTRGPKPFIEEVESDRARVLYSASFRRLQRKTQVFPLEDNASVRTRMTHSLEVAHVGRYLGSSVVEHLKRRRLIKLYEMDTERQLAFPTIIEVACLLHDIGNPPFGHFGEVAIARWFKGFNRNLGNEKKDFVGFDGNPQGFRIVSRLAGDDGRTGMNLTLTQLAATLKYPVTSHELSGYTFKKFGVFDSESSTLDALRDKFQLKKGVRFPLACLMEAADDISYCLSDIEDGAEKGICTYEEIVQDLFEKAPTDEVRRILSTAERAAKKSAPVNKIVAFRSTLIRHLVEFASSKYVEEHDRILEGAVNELIDGFCPEGRLLKLIKDTVRGRIYSHSSVQSLELAGLAVITSLLGHFGRLLELSREEFLSLQSSGGKNGLEIERRLLDFIAGKHRSAYENSVKRASKHKELVCRAHMIVDYISGMTDSFALDMHQMLTGSKL